MTSEAHIIEVKLPSGANLRIQIAEFAVSKALAQALSKELNIVSLKMDAGLPEFMKQLFCESFSSPTIEKCIWDCMERCTINKIKITKDSFEPIEARGDYLEVLLEVAKANVAPFTKSLFAQYQKFSEILEKSLV